MKKIIIASFLLSSIAFGQNAGNAIYTKLQDHSIGQPATQKTNDYLRNKMISININGLINVEPEAQIAVFSLVQLGQDANEARSLLSSKTDPILKKLVEIGIPRKDIALDMISFIPRYEATVEKKVFSKSFTEIPKGFELKKNLHIRYKNHELLDQVIAICAEHEVFDLAKVEYVIKNPEEQKQKLKEALLKSVSQKIAFYHQLKVQDSIVIHTITEQNQEYYPEDRYQNYTAFSSSSFDAVINQKKGIKNVTRATKNKTIFYDPVSTRNFDIILNPGGITPKIQYASNLTITYYLPEKTKKVEVKPVALIEPKKEIILITPNGELKELNLN